MKQAGNQADFFEKIWGKKQEPDKQRNFRSTTLEGEKA